MTTEARQLMRWVVTAAGLALLAPWVTARAGTASSMQVDLEPILQDHGISHEAVSFSAAVLLNKGDVGEAGWVGSANRGSLIVKPLSQASDGIGRSLRLSFNGAQMSAASCDARGECSDIALDEKGTGYAKLTFESAQWRVKYSAPVCVDSLTCTIELSSWAMEQRRQANSAAFAAIPNKLLVVAHSAGIDLVAAETGAIWMHWPKTEGGLVDRLGQLQGVFAAGTGALGLRGTGAGAIVDFEHDRVIWLDNKGVAISNARAGGFGYAAADRLVDVAESGGLIGFDNSGAAWRNGSVSLNLGATVNGVAGSYVDSGAAIFAADSNGNGLFAASCANNRVAVHRIDGSEILSHGQAGICSNTGKMILVGSTLVEKTTANGWQQITASGKSRTSIGQGLVARAVGNNHVILETTAGGACSAEAYLQHATVAGSFSGTGMLSPDCSSVFGYSAAGLALTSRDGATVTIRALIP